MQIVAPNEPVVLISFETSIGDVSGMINFCIPFLVIEPVTAQFSAQTWFGYAKGGKAEKNKVFLQKGLEEAAVDCVVELAETNISVSDFLNLKVGDVLMTDTLTSSEISFIIESKEKFRGKAGAFHRHKAIQLTRKID